MGIRWKNASKFIEDSSKSVELKKTKNEYMKFDNLRMNNVASTYRRVAQSSSLWTIERKTTELIMKWIFFFFFQIHTIQCFFPIIIIIMRTI